MEDKIAQARRITKQFNMHGCEVALNLILAGLPALDALNYAREHYSNTPSNEKLLKEISNDARLAEMLNKTEVRLHYKVLDGHWMTVKMHPTHAERWARQAFKDGATDIKIY